MELGAVRAPGVFAQLRAPDLLFHRVDVFVAQQHVGNLRSEPHGFRQRSAWRGDRLKNEMALAKLGKELAAEKRQTSGGQNAENQDDGDDRPGPAGDKSQDPAIARFEPALQARILGSADAFAENEKRQRRSHGQSDQQ